MARKFNWQTLEPSGFRAKMPANVTLFATPDRTTGFNGKPARGTTWRAGATHWDAPKCTLSRYGRDEYMTQHKTAKDAMRAAESIYSDASEDC